MKKKPTLAAAGCLGIAVVIFLATCKPFYIDIGILNIVLPFAFTTAAVVYGVRAVKLRRNVLNYIIVTVASVLSVFLLYAIIFHLAIYGLDAPDDPPWPDWKELENSPAQW